jgi:hypothetical protein
MDTKPLKIGGFSQGIYEESSTQKETIGSRRFTEDGRVFAYAKNGAVALAAAKITQSAVPDTNAHDEAMPGAVALGATNLSVTFGGAIAQDAYKDGFMHVNDGTGEGHIYRVKGHPAATAANSYTVTVQLHEPIRVALVITTSLVTFTKHPQDAVIVYPTTGTSVPAGVPLIPVTAAYYFWNQVKGPCPILTDGTVVIGQHVRVSDGTAGAVEPLDRDGTAEDEAAVGTVLQVNVTTDYSIIMLDIPGY